ncbi:MAG: hypothetical protein AAGD32_05075 [Planctomycetota bacterium]
MNALLLSVALMTTSADTSQPVSWDQDSTWYDGLVEKATYDATRVIYGKARSYEAIFLTNKEQHETATWTKATGGSVKTVEVWKHNQIEVVPTPNYDYKFTTTSHLTVDGLELTRMDMSESEWCGTTFAQYIKTGDGYDYFSFGYMPGEGRQTGTVSGDVVPVNALPLYLRDFDFAAGEDVTLSLLPDQKSNRLQPFTPVEGTIKYLGEVDGGYELEVHIGGNLFGTYTMADRDRLHVMLSFESADGTQTYKLKSQDRVNYWSIKE